MSALYNKAPHLHISSYSNGSCTCVGVQFDEHRTVQVIDTKQVRPSVGNRRNFSFQVTVHDWTQFLAELTANPHPIDRPHTAGPISTSVDADDLIAVRHGGVTLRFDRDEWRAFVLGVQAGEFDLRKAA